MREFSAEYGEDPDFYAANFYENAFVMWEVHAAGARRAAATSRGDALDAALQENLTVVSVYGGDESTVGTYTLDPTTHSVIKREMGVFEYKDGAVTPKAFFGIGGADYHDWPEWLRPGRGPTTARVEGSSHVILAVDVRDAFAS